VIQTLPPPPIQKGKFFLFLILIQWSPPSLLQVIYQEQKEPQEKTVLVSIEELSDIVEKSQKVLVSAPSNGWEKAVIKVVGDLVSVIEASIYKQADFAVLLIECRNRRVVNCLYELENIGILLG
jgi:hypothetical protein